MTDADRLAWLEERRTGVGSSDVADVVGKGWSGPGGPLRVYRSKVEPADPRPPEGVLRRGHDLEGLVAGMYREVMGVELTAVPLARHPLVPWAIASNDRTRPDGRKVELKTTTGFGPDWGEQGSGDVPEVYRLQCEWQMYVTGAAGIDLFALDVVSWRTRMYRLDADAGRRSFLAAAAHAFWHDHVLRRVPPGPEWLERLGPPPLDAGADAVDLGDGWASLLELRRQHQRDRDAAEAKVKEIDAQLRAAMGAAPRATAGRFAVRRTLVPGCRVSYDRQAYERLDIRSK